MYIEYEWEMKYIKLWLPSIKYARKYSQDMTIFVQKHWLSWKIYSILNKNKWKRVKYEDLIFQYHDEKLMISTIFRLININWLDIIKKWVWKKAEYMLIYWAVILLDEKQNHWYRRSEQELRYYNTISF